MTAAAEVCSTSGPASANAETFETNGIPGDDSNTSLRRYRVQHHRNEQNRQIEHCRLQQLSRPLLRDSRCDGCIEEGEAQCNTEKGEPHHERDYEVDFARHS